MSIEVEQDITVTTRGEFSEQVKEVARQRVARACTHLAEPVLFAEVKLAHEPDPARERPYLAEAVVTLSAVTLRAHVASSDALAAVDLLDERLTSRIHRHNSRRADRHRQGVSVHAPGDHEWHHGDLPTQRPEHFDRPVDERELVRHKTFVVGEMTPDEAADALDLLGHDFLLFTNLNTGADAVVCFNGDGLELIDVSGRADAVGDQTVAPI